MRGSFGRGLRKECVLLMGVWLVLGSPARAGASAEVVHLTWPQIVGLVDQHPQLSAGAFRIEAAREGVEVAGAVPNPTLEGTVGQGRARDGGPSRVEWALALTMPLGWIAQRGSQIDAAEAEVEVALAESEALRRDVLLSLRVLFWSLAYEQARVASLAELEEQTAVLVQMIRRRVDKGEARPMEGTRVELEQEKVAIEHQSARTSLGARQAEMALWLGVPLSARIVVDADLGTLPAVLDRDATLSRARASHPALRLAQAKTDLIAAQLRSERRARVPSVSLKGYTASELDRRAYGAGLAVDVPLWSWNAGRIGVAQAQLAAGKKQSEATQWEVEASLFAVQAACQGAAETAARLRTEVVPRAEAATAMIEKTYQLGEANLLEVIDARRTLLEARRSSLSALVQAHIDCSRLTALVGEEPQK